MEKDDKIVLLCIFFSLLSVPLIMIVSFSYASLCEQRWETLWNKHLDVSDLNQEEVLKFWTLCGDETIYDETPRLTRS